MSAFWDTIGFQSGTHTQGANSTAAQSIAVDVRRELSAHNIFRWLLAYFFLANIPIWACQRFFLAPPRAIFNVDYVIVGILGLYIPATLYYGAFTVVFLIDLLASSTAIYYFSQRDLISATKYVAQLPSQQTILLAAVLLVCGFGLAALCRRVAGPIPRTRRRFMSISFCSLSVVFLGMGAFTGSTPLDVSTSLRDPDLIAGHKVGTSMTRRTAISIWEIARSNPVPTAFTHSPSATEPLLIQLYKGSAGTVAWGQRRNIVLVLVESYGFMNDPRGAAKLESPYRSPAVMAKYAIQSGTVPFDGPTVSGEFRELCGLRGDINSAKLAGTVAENCLPDLMKKHGYDTTAIHGFLGTMFDRNIWYRALGFENVQFKEDLKRLPGFHECSGIFQGVCDTDIARFLGSQSSSEIGGKPHFYYWLTLNSHLPVQISTQNSTLLDCGSPRAANPDISICNWMALVYKVNVAIAELSTTSNLARTEFIIVGDHAPPFRTGARREQFSQQVVPFIHLLPKS
jgi:hypothetical protein